MLWTYAWQVRRPRDTCCPPVFTFCIYTSQVGRPRDTCCPLVFMLCICTHRSEGQETRAVPWCSCYVSVLTGQKAKGHMLSPGVHVMYLFSQVRRPRDTCCPLVFTLCIYTSQVRRPRDTCCPLVTRSPSLTSRMGWWRWSGIPCQQSTYSSPTTTAGSACSTRTVCPRSLTSRCRALRPPYTHCHGYPALPACLPPAVRQHIHLISDS